MFQKLHSDVLHKIFWVQKEFQERKYIEKNSERLVQGVLCSSEWKNSSECPTMDDMFLIKIDAAKKKERN